MYGRHRDNRVVDLSKNHLLNRDNHSQDISLNEKDKQNLILRNSERKELIENSNRLIKNSRIGNDKVNDVSRKEC